MKAGDKAKILAESDVLGGLVVDLHTPLNLTENFDGQKTGQHGLWVRLVEKLPQAIGKDLKVSPDAARYLDNPKEYVFSMLGPPTSGSTTSCTWRSWPGAASGYGDPYFEALARRLGPILRERSRARPRTRAATGTRPGWRRDARAEVSPGAARALGI